MAFLQVLTRCYRRPNLLMANIRSLEAQTDPDWRQTLLVDGEGRGVGAAQAALSNHAPQVRGEWIHIVDDDDRYIRPTLIAELKEIVREHEPDVIITRMDHGRRGVLPDAAHWQREPAHGHIGVSAVVVRRELFTRHAPAFASAHYASDFDFIRALFSSDPDVYWHDVIASQVQRISIGAAE
jgi:glycosyltransferase involved in cell wall biosynthesis